MSTDLDKDHKTWLGELTLELRLLDVSGRDAGDAVASAREFLADSGAPAAEVFGDAREYAVALGLAPAPGAEESTRRGVLVALVGLVGFAAVAWAAGPAWRGEDFELSAATAVLLGLIVVLVLATPRYFSTVLRAAPWKVVLGMVGVLALQVLISFALDDVAVVEVPALPVAVVGSVLLLGNAVWWHWEGRDGGDPLREPLGPEPVCPASNGWR